jgi:hypothetical protein
MKKHYLIVLAVAIFSHLTAFTAPYPPVRYLEVLYASEPMVMDGNANEAGYSDLQSTDLFNATGWDDGPADFTASIKLTWDSYYLYLYAEMTDDVEESYDWAYSSPWTFDNAEIFLQLDTNTVITAYDGHTVQLRICRGLDSMETPGRALRSDYGYSISNSDTGWIFEVAIPWTCALAVGEGPELFEQYWNTEIGFEFHGADSDNLDGDPTIGNRDVQTAWDPDDPDYCHDWHDECNAWNNTAIFGRIYLSTALAVPTLEESNVGVFPNPADNKIHFNNIEPGSSVEIYTITGTKVMDIITVDTMAVINISSLKSGLYALVINHKEAARFVKE